MEPTQDQPDLVKPGPTFRPVGTYCPRCGKDSLITDFGAQLMCGHCGLNWQADMDVLEVWLTQLQKPQPPQRTGAEETMPGLVPLVTELPS